MNILAAHLIGDFILQNDWMQQKSKSSFVCLVHVVIYMYVMRLASTLALWQIALIGAQHFVWDRWSVARWWIKAWKQTPPDKWPQGPLWVDQAWHIAWLAFVMEMA